MNIIIFQQNFSERGDILASSCIINRTIWTQDLEIEREERKRERERAKMVLLEKLWDDIVAGPQPERGLGMLRKPKPLNIKSNTIIL